MSVIRALLVRIAGEPYAFPLNRIDRIVRARRRSSVRRLEGRPALRDGRPAGRPGRGGPGAGAAPSRARSDDPMPVVVVERPEPPLRRGRRRSSWASATSRSGRSTRGSARSPDINSASVLEDGWPVLIVDVEDLVRSIDNLLGGRRLEVVGRRRRRPRRRRRRPSGSWSWTTRSPSASSSGSCSRAGATSSTSPSTASTAGTPSAAGDYRPGHQRRRHAADGRHRARPLDQAGRPAASRSRSSSSRTRTARRTGCAGSTPAPNAYLTKSSFHDQTFLDTVADLIGEAQG